MPNSAFGFATTRNIYIVPPRCKFEVMFVNGQYRVYNGNWDIFEGEPMTKEEADRRVKEVHAGWAESYQLGGERYEA